jgi:hypothetical protein
MDDSTESRLQAAENAANFFFEQRTGMDAPVSKDEPVEPREINIGDTVDAILSEHNSKDLVNDLLAMSGYSMERMKEFFEYLKPTFKLAAVVERVGFELIAPRVHADPALLVKITDNMVQDNLYDFFMALKPIVNIETGVSARTKSALIELLLACHTGTGVQAGGGMLSDMWSAFKEKNVVGKGIFIILSPLIVALHVITKIIEAGEPKTLRAKVDYIDFDDTTDMYQMMYADDDMSQGYDDLVKSNEDLVKSNEDKKEEIVGLNNELLLIKCEYAKFAAQAALDKAAAIDDLQQRWASFYDAEKQRFEEIKSDLVSARDYQHSDMLSYFRQTEEWYLNESMKSGQLRLRQGDTMDTLRADMARLMKARDVRRHRPPRPLHYAAKPRNFDLQFGGGFANYIAPAALLITTIAMSFAM